MGFFLYGGHKKWLLDLPDFLKVSFSFDNGNCLRYVKQNKQSLWETLPSFAFTCRVWPCCMDWMGSVSANAVNVYLVYG